MQRRIVDVFRELLVTVTPLASHSSVVVQHRASVKSCLSTHFSVRRFFRTGSSANGTSLSGYSDVDYFVDIGREDLGVNSIEALRRMRDVLADRFPLTRMRVSCPSLRVRFGTAVRETTEIVPAGRVTDIDKYSVYDIPDCQGGWTRSSPDAHNAYVDSINAMHRGRVKSLIRLVKAWKFFNNIPVSSFYLALRVAKFAEREAHLRYEYALSSFFNALDKTDLSPMKDPAGISGYVYPCASSTLVSTVQYNVRLAALQADMGLEAYSKNDTRNTFYWWNALFAGKLTRLKRRGKSCH